MFTMPENMYLVGRGEQESRVTGNRNSSLYLHCISSVAPETRKYQNQENLKISAATHNCANLIQGISGMPTNTVTRSPAVLQMCLGRMQET